MADLFAITLVVLYFVVSAALGIYSRKWIKTSEHFYGANKLFGWIIIGIAASAAAVSGWTFIGGPGLLYMLGGGSMWMYFAVALCYPIAWWVLGKRIRLFVEVRPVATLPDIAAARYKSNAVRVLLAVGILLGVFAYLATQVLAGGFVLSGLLGISLETAIIITFGVIIFYTVIGGMAASIITDFFQGLVMLFVIILTVILVLMMTGGVGPMLLTIAEKDPSFIDPLGKASWILVLSWAFGLGISVGAQPHTVTKFLAMRDYKDLRPSLIVAVLGYMAGAIVWFFIGYGATWLVATGQSAPPTRPDEATIILLKHLPVWSYALLYAGALAAIMSTSSAFISLGVAALVRDIPKGFGKELGHREQILYGRIATIIVTVAALIFGYYGGELVALIGALGMTYFGAAIFPSLTIGLNWKRATREAAIVSLLLAHILNIGFLIWTKVLGGKLPFGVQTYVVSLGVAIIAMIIVSFLTKSAAEDDIDPDVKIVMET
jgi:Na+/proline symporter